MNKKKLIASLSCIALSFTTAFSGQMYTVRADANVEETVDTWTDVGKYTKAWYNPSTDQDIYKNLGTEDDPFEIRNASDLAAFSYYSNVSKIDYAKKYIKITVKEIDLSAHYWFPIGQTVSFKGNFDGNDCVIKNIFIGRKSDACTYTYSGLFGSSAGNISNLKINNFRYYVNSTYTGGLLAQWTGGSISNCYVSGKIYNYKLSSSIGGLIGCHNYGGEKINNCDTNVSIDSSVHNAWNTYVNIGGIIGWTNCKMDMSNCRASGNIITGYQYRNGGCIGVNSSVSTLNNITTNVSLLSSSYCSSGGMIGQDDSSVYATNCKSYGDISLTEGGSAGGFLGYKNSNTNCVYKNCYAAGSISGKGTSCNIGGFGGYMHNLSINQCGASGNVTIIQGNIGGFSGNCDYINIYNSFSLGNVEAEKDSSAAGFCGYIGNNSRIENCYTASSIFVGTNCKLGGFSANTGSNPPSFKRCYWNKSATQQVNKINLANEKKIGVGYGNYLTVEAASESYMKTNDFIQDLNEYIDQSNIDYDKWTRSSSLFGGYPYIETLGTFYNDIQGGSEEFILSKPDETKEHDMNVYGTFVYPEIPATVEPTESPEPQDETIHINVEWGSLEYLYTAGEYDTKTETYADGIWTPKEAGKTDLITITNKSESDIKAGFSFLPSKVDNGNFMNIKGIFNDVEVGDILNDNFVISAKQGDIELQRSVCFGLDGAPIHRIDNDSPEVIGQIILTLCKHEKEEIIPSIEPSAEVSDEPSVVVSDEPSAVTSDKPCVVTSDEPSAVNSDEPSVVVSDEPSVATSDEPSAVTSDEPSVVTSDEPSVVTSDEPSVVTSDEPSVATSDEPSVVTSNEPSVVTSNEPSSQPNVA